MVKAASRKHHPSVVVASGKTANSLGVVRAFGRRGIEVVLLRVLSRSPARFSRYVRENVQSLPPGKSNSDFLNVLLKYGRQESQRPVIIPTGDEEVMQISEHRRKLRHLFRFSVADHDLLHSFVNKRRFYHLIKTVGLAHPVTFFPDSLPELRSLGTDLEYPFLIKPSDSLAFQEEFQRKCFVIENPQELDRAIQALDRTELQILVQEIIPGNGFHEVYYYFNRLGRLIAQCGWDRLRQFPPGFGNATYCRNTFRPEPADLGAEFLRGAGYCGLAAIEFKHDPRDDQFKMIEVNPRTTLQNRLSASCGVDIEWIAYQDLLGRNVKSLQPPNTGALWVDDFTDVVSKMSHLLSGNSAPREYSSRKVRSIASWDDPLPLLARMLFLFLYTTNLLLNRFRQKMSENLSRKQKDR